MIGQQLLNGLVVGTVYTLFSLGFTLVFGVLNILNLAHGAVFMWGAFIGLYAVTVADLPLPVAFALGMIGGGVLSVVVDFVAFRPLRARRADDFGALVASLGVNLVLISLAQQLSNAKIMNFPFGTFPVVLFQALGLRITLLQVGMVACTAVLFGGLLYYLYVMPFGRQVRAVAVSEKTAVLLGVNPTSVYVQTFFIAGALAGAAGVIIGLAFNSVQFLMGDAMMLRAFLIIVLGGIGSVLGTAVAGLLLGVVQTLLVAYVSSRLSDVILFSLLFATLLIRPTGFMRGLRQTARVVRQ